MSYVTPAFENRTQSFLPNIQSYKLGGDLSITDGSLTMTQSIKWQNVTVQNPDSLF